MEQTEIQKLRSIILSSLTNEPIDATEKELGYSAAMADVIKIIDEHTNRKVKQTAVEWLYEKISQTSYVDIKDYVQAKKMEKEQINDKTNTKPNYDFISGYKAAEKELPTWDDVKLAIELANKNINRLSMEWAKEDIIREIKKSKTK